MKKDLKLTIAGSTGFVIAAASILVLGIAITSISNPYHCSYYCISYDHDAG
jgi:hypothetical protein